MDYYTLLDQRDEPSFEASGVILENPGPTFE